MHISGLCGRLYVVLVTTRCKLEAFGGRLTGVSVIVVHQEIFVTPVPVLSGRENGFKWTIGVMRRNNMVLILRKVLEYRNENESIENLQIFRKKCEKLADFEVFCQILLR